MKRRDFLKLIGLSVVAPALPAGEVAKDVLYFRGIPIFYKPTLDLHSDADLFVRDVRVSDDIDFYKLSREAMEVGRTHIRLPGGEKLHIKNYTATYKKED